MSSNNSSYNRNLVPEAKQGLNRLKNEVASEVGLQNYENINKGDLTSKQNGSVGGEMVKRMVESYEQSIK
ncbi:MAG: alpha/beta-type small acid-soluble spore protein [Clostridium celatum]|uniref:alpha/beta-type small acid-soluble spore protein n=1 Tax=Clostridium sp. TaxID=1506 RepID=UPI0026390750|nr:alpha/beta-type small acid-soluble spore protein [Clostridium sp.]MBS6183568.1 alpha/beta-type small acid-soluble spore protein [Clostridium celatum]MDU2123086.1 alpha/beta-type small acid-soluble spore protein [Clostridium celatum]MDU4979672.1 alpha/beta-type small acid-soluble spore protein [Clostridium celatum]